MNKKKLFLIMLVCFLGLILVSSLFLNIKKYGEKLEIIFFDVGQGDSSLIKLPNNKLVLIDGGPDNLALNRLGKYIPYYQRKIDLVILSHFHDDHIIGLIEILNRYKVDSLIYMKGTKESQLLKILLDKAKQKNVRIIALENKMEISYLNNCSIKLYNPLVLKVKLDDNNSIITSVNCGSLKALLTGDGNLEVEKALLNTGENWSANIFKASHHGSKTANSEEFLKQIKPSLVVISVGLDNRFNHPSQEVISRLKSLKIKFKRTDELGSIIFPGLP